MRTQEDQEQLNEELQFAARKGQVEKIKTLIKSGADFNAKNDMGETPLHFASEKGHTEAIRTLISLGADINAKNENGDIPLHYATLNRSTIAFETLIKLGADINAKNEKGRTPLFYAAEIGYVGTVDTLIKLGADPYSVDNEGNTVLLRACSSLSALDDDVVSLINFLCEKGVVDLHRVNKKGNNALHISATVGERAKDTVKTINTLVDLGVNVDAYNEEGKTPLHVAVLLGYNNAGAKVLLDCKANPNLADKEGNTPFHYIVRFSEGNPENISLIKHLIEKGADVNLANEKDGITPLQIAVEKCNTGTIKLLLENGANTDSFTAEPNENKTLIEVIALNASIPKQRKLINFDELFKYGAEINTQFLEDPNSDISNDIRNYLRQLDDIEKRNQELHDKYVASILNWDPLPRCNDFIGGVILQAIKSIELDQIKDNSEIKKSAYYKLIGLNDNNDTSDKLIKTILKYSKEFEKLVETSSKLKATSKGVTQGSQIYQTQTPQTEVLFDINLMGIILEKYLSPKFKEALGASDARMLIDYLMEYKKNDSITKRLDLVKEKQETGVLSGPGSSTQSRAGSPTQRLVEDFSQIRSGEQGGGRSAS